MVYFQKYSMNLIINWPINLEHVTVIREGTGHEWTRTRRPIRSKGHPLLDSGRFVILVLLMMDHLETD